MKLGTWIHSVLSGLVLQVVGSVLAAVGGGLFSVTALLHIALGAVGVFISAYVVRNSPTWLTWLGGKLGGAPPASAAGIVLLVLALPLASCSPPVADAAPVLASGPIGFAGALAPGDSLGPYTFTVPAVPGATGYSWTLTTSATNGTWSNVPAGTTTTAPSLSFTLAASAGVWDSVSLQLCVKGTSGVRSTKVPACASWKVYRYLPTPTSLSGDSSHLGLMSLMVRSPTEDTITAHGANAHITVATNGTIQFCTVARFGSGDLALLGTDTTCMATALRDFRPDRFQHLTVQEQNFLAGACSPWSACLLGYAPRVAPDALRTRRA